MLLGSLAGYMGSEHQSIYSSAKAFSRVFAESLWLELAPYNVHVVELILGVTRTPAMIRAGLNFDNPGHDRPGAGGRGPRGPSTSPTVRYGWPWQLRRRREAQWLPPRQIVKGAAEAMRKLLNRS